MTELATVARLSSAPLTVLGMYANASNATMLVHLSDDGPPQVPPGQDPLDVLASRDLGVWKPVAGQQPLWDFDAATLPHREVAAGIVDRLLGTDLVPPTVWRDGPHGPGSLQAHVPHDPTRHLLEWVDGPDRDDATLAALVVFDLVVNNTDRKSGHVLVAADRIWAIDHGVTFHVDDKVRTVAWQLEGTPVPADLRGAAARLADRLVAAPGELVGHLAADEIAATVRRARAVAATADFPGLTSRAQLPWPLV